MCWYGPYKVMILLESNTIEEGYGGLGKLIEARL